MLSHRTNRIYPLVLAGVLSLTAHSQETIPAEQFLVPENLEVSIWAKSPLFHNPSRPSQ